MVAVFSRIDFITPFVKGQVVRGIVLAFLAMFLWVVMVAYISWLRNDAVKKAIEEEEN
jgi:EamA domain-containing membrane protein RarD